MILTSVTKILESIRSPYQTTRTLENLTFQHLDNGKLFYIVGNNVVLFKIKIDDKWHTMRCYMLKHRNLRAIYGDKYLKDELFIYSPTGHDSWIDVVVEEWIEGITLQAAVGEALKCGDREALGNLADKFDSLALTMLDAPWAHGDITLENIIVAEGGELRLIDFDCIYKPQFCGEQSPEIGTPAFQPPLRTTAHFNPHIDDYSLALISTALRALSIEPEMYDMFPFRDGLLLDPQLIARNRCKALDYIMQLFLNRGMASKFRVVKLLTSSMLHIAPLRDIFYCDVVQPESGAPLVVTSKFGMIGYSTPDGRIIIPHIYDDGGDFYGGEAEVCLDGVWMSIDERGKKI